jgi:hypothetical protein
MEAIEDHIDADETLSANECQALMRTADLVLLKPPDAQWMLNTIGSLNSAHAIFQREYVNIKPLPNRPQFRFQFDNHDHFFDDLPPLSMNVQKGRTLALPKEAQLRQKIMIA